MRDIYSNVIKQAEQAEKELCLLLDKINTETLLSAAIVQLQFRSPEEAGNDMYGHHSALVETIAFYSIPRFGNNTEKSVSHFEFNQCYSLAEKVLFGRMSTSKLDGDLTLSNRLASYSEIVRGSAYPEQTAQEIIEIQGKFDDWFKQEIGISPSKAVEITHAIIKHTEIAYNANSNECYEHANQYQEKYKQLKKNKLPNGDTFALLHLFDNENEAGGFAFFNKLNEIAPRIFPVRIEELNTQQITTEQEANALKKLIGISKESFNPNIEMQRFPLYILNSGKVLISDWSNCLDVLFDAFDKIAETNNQFYADYQNHKAKWLEKKARCYLERIFPVDVIYDTLDYPNPDKAGTTELDIAVKWNPFVLLIEAKAKKFRFESIQGNEKQLKHDLKRNVIEAYEQSLRATRYINSSEKAIFIERNTQRKLELNKNSTQKIYSISLTLHHLAGVTTQLKDTQELGLFKDNTFPLSICIADLDLITKTNITPDIFLHYIEKRFAILNDKRIWRGDEIDLFSAYLDCRLNIKNLPLHEAKETDSLSFAGYSVRFNRLAMYERGELTEKPDISFSMPEEILEVLQNLRTWNDENARWIAFNLLELENKLLMQLAGAISDLKVAKLEAGVFRRFSIENKNIVINVIASSSASLEELNNQITLRTATEKYRRKLDKGMSLGLMRNNNSHHLTFETAVYIEGKWEKNELFDNAINNDSSLIAVRGKLPQRNEPCFCGSGLKYKKCCLQKVEENQKKR